MNKFNKLISSTTKLQDFKKKKNIFVYENNWIGTCKWVTLERKLIIKTDSKQVAKHLHCLGRLN